MQRSGAARCLSSTTITSSVRWRDFDFGRDRDVYYGCYYPTDPGNLAGSDIIGAHMMGFSAKGAREIWASIAALEFEAEHLPIDGAYVRFRRAHPKVDPFRRAAAGQPAIVAQRHRRSALFRQAAAAARDREHRTRHHAKFSSVSRAIPLGTRVDQGTALLVRR